MRLKATEPAHPIKAPVSIRGGVMYTLNSVEIHAVCYVIGSYESKGMKSENPHAGIHETEVSRTLDAANCCYPACHQGGVAVVEIHSSGKSSE